MTQERCRRICRDALNTSCESVEMVAWAIARHYSLDAAECDRVHVVKSVVQPERHAL